MVLAGAVYFTYRHRYPYGARPACLPVLLAALQSYSDKHGGAFPNEGKGPLEALMMLYPDQLADCEPIAGLSGDRKLLKKQIADGSPISEAASSWVYWPGLRSDDDPEIALIWERRSGLRFNGSRAYGHEVGFVGGYMRQISDVAWQSFLKDQERLRQEAMTKRRAKHENAPVR